MDGLPGNRYILGGSSTDEKTDTWKKELEERFPGYEIVMDRLSLSVSCHIGPGAMAVACSKVIE